MSDTQAKATPSKAARELAMALGLRQRKEHNGLRTGSFEVIPEAAQTIQSALSDLLEKAQTLNVYIEARWGDSDATIQGLNRPLKSALEPWKPGE